MHTSNPSPCFVSRLVMDREYERRLLRQQNGPVSSPASPLSVSNAVCLSLVVVHIYICFVVSESCAKEVGEVVMVWSILWVIA